MKLFTYLLLSVILVQNGFTQTIKRLPESKVGISTTPIKASIKSNVFTDFGWLEPSVKSQKILFEDGSYFFMLNGSAFQLKKFENTMMQLQGRGTSSLLSVETSKNTIYYDKTILKKVAVTKEKWISLQPQKWQWGNTLDSVLTIPAYNYYEFAIHDNMTIMVYETENTEGKTEYFLQNASYLFATNEEGINYILLDINCNGLFTDSADRILFNSWNPYSNQSYYKKIKGLEENTWYDMAYLYNEYFLTFNYTNGKLAVSYENDLYKNIEKTGTIEFSHLPKHATLKIGDKEYLPEQKLATFTCEYGMYKAIISNKGLLDQEVTFSINNNHLKQEIKYLKQQAAGELTLKNIFSNNYFVTISNKNGYRKTYYNTDAFTIPVGKNYITLNIDGCIINRSISISKKGTISLDFKDGFIQEK